MIESLEEAKMQVAVGASYCLHYILTVNIYDQGCILKSKVRFNVDIYKPSGISTHFVAGRRQFAQWVEDQIRKANNIWGAYDTWWLLQDITTTDPISAKFVICEHNGQYKLLWSSTDDIPSSCKYI